MNHHKPHTTARSALAVDVVKPPLTVEAGVLPGAEIGQGLYLIRLEGILMIAAFLVRDDRVR
jgi:hypothetical protein